MTKIVGIYKITAPDGKIYIGQTKNFALRVMHHKFSGKKGSKIKESMRVHGPESHKFELIHELPKDVTQDILNEYEHLYLEQYKECGIEVLNLRHGGTTGKHGKESIEKMKGKLGMWMVGRKLSEETIAKRSAKQKGMKRSEESKERYRQSRIGDKNPMFGKTPHNKGKKLSENHIKSLKEAWERRKQNNQ